MKPKPQSLDDQIKYLDWDIFNLEKEMKEARDKIKTNRLELKRKLNDLSVLKKQKRELVAN
jgi:septal ring factor EnvC (AmiA/AmiB activator)